MPYHYDFDHLHDVSIATILLLAVFGTVVWMWEKIKPERRDSLRSSL